MGFTPLEGLVMATRSGSVDPGMLLWLLEREEVTADQMAEALEHDRGCSGYPAARTCVRCWSAPGEAISAAALALAVYLHGLRGAIAAMASSLGGLDTLVFTGGVGEGSSEVRARASAELAFIGVRLDGERNRQAHGDAAIGAELAPVQTLVLTAREDLEIASQVRAVLQRS